MKKHKDIEIELKGYLAHVEIQRPPNNFFDYLLIEQIADHKERIFVLGQTLVKMKIC
jgi:hypothetical protein